MCNEVSKPERPGLGRPRPRSQFGCWLLWSSESPGEPISQAADAPQMSTQNLWVSPFFVGDPASQDCGTHGHLVPLGEGGSHSLLLILLLMLLLPAYL